MHEEPQQETMWRSIARGSKPCEKGVELKFKSFQSR